jgi:ankyrin repeat protein
MADPTPSEGDSTVPLRSSRAHGGIRAALPSSPTRSPTRAANYLSPTHVSTRVSKQRSSTSSKTNRPPARGFKGKSSTTTVPTTLPLDPSLALNKAIHAKDLVKVTKLIQSGFDVNRPYHDASSSFLTTLEYEGLPLYHAASAGKDITKLLLDSGAVVNAQYSFLGTALQEAARYGDYETVELLINAGADINAIPGYDVTALACATESDKATLEKVRLLLQHGADVNGKGQGGTPLDRAVYLVRPLLCLILLAHGADITAGSGFWFKGKKRPVPNLWHKLSRRQSYHSIVRLGSDLISGHAIEAIRAISIDWAIPSGLVRNLDRSSPTFDYPRKGSSAELIARQFVLVGERSRVNKSSRILGTLCSAFVSEHWGNDGLLFLQCFMNNLSFEGDLEGLFPCLTGIKCLRLTMTKGCAIVHDHLGTSICEYLDKISFSESRIKLLLGKRAPPLEALKTILSVVSFLCAAIMDPLDAALFKFVTTSSRIALEVDPLGIMDVERPLHLRLSVDKAPFHPSQYNCWQNLLEGGVIAQIETAIPTLALPGRGIALTFKNMIALASIERPVVVKNTIVLIGYRTALIPVEIHNDFVQYHLVVSESDQINPHLFPNQLGRAADVNNIDQLLNKFSFVGWCEEAIIQLGTTLQTDLNTPRYSTAREKGESFNISGMSVAMSAMLPAPVQIGPTLQLEGTFQINRVKFPYSFGYAELLRDTSRKTILLYDTETKRGWMLPKLSLLLHMCHAYMAFHQEQDSIPIIPGSIDAGSIVKGLENEGTLVLYGSDPHQFRLHTLLHGLNYNMCLVSEKTEPTKGLTLNGFEFRDIFEKPDKGAWMKTITLDGNGKSWIPIANLADGVLFGAGFGDVVIASSEIGNCGRSSNCTVVPTGLEYLTATVPYMRRFVNEEVQDFQIQITKGVYWAISMASFNRCNHGQGKNSCWDRVETFQQLLKAKLRKKGGQRPQISLSKLPERGAVVFGFPLPSRTRKVSCPYHRQHVA